MVVFLRIVVPVNGTEEVDIGYQLLQSLRRLMGHARNLAETERSHTDRINTWWHAMLVSGVQGASMLHFTIGAVIGAVVSPMLILMAAYFILLKAGKRGGLQPPSLPSHPIVSLDLE